MERGFVLSIIRIKFKKDENVKFISHLDMMKAFQRAIRRAGLKAGYSQGFNPQMQMIFGAPLSLGFTSGAEYADFTFTEDYDPAYIVEMLNKALPPGLLVIDAGTRTTNKNIMADIKFAGYSFSITTGKAISNIAKKLQESEKLIVKKTRKGKTKEVDIKPMILEINPMEGKLNVLVKAGNETNLNPRLLMEAVKIHIDLEAEGNGYNRIEQYVERNGKMISPLDKIALETK